MPPEKYAAGARSLGSGRWIPDQVRDDNPWGIGSVIPAPGPVIPAPGPVIPAPGPVIPASEPGSISQPVIPASEPRSISQTVIPASEPGSISQTVIPASEPGSISQTVIPASEPGSISQTVIPASEPGSISQTVIPASEPGSIFQRGFTLIEVLVALGITAVALMAGLQATGSLSRNADRQTVSMLGQICADNELMALRLRRQLPNTGNNSIACTQAGRTLQVEVSVRPTPNPNFRRVDARVLDQGVFVLQVSTVMGRN